MELLFAKRIFAYRANITSSPSLLFKHKAMDGWMVGWLVGRMPGWMDGNDVDEFLWNPH